MQPWSRCAAVLSPRKSRNNSVKVKKKNMTLTLTTNMFREGTVSKIWRESMKKVRKLRRIKTMKTKKSNGGNCKRPHSRRRMRTIHLVYISYSIYLTTIYCILIDFAWKISPLFWNFVACNSVIWLFTVKMKHLCLCKSMHQVTFKSCD